MANEATFQLKEINGGINWGYCQENAKLISTNKYIAEVETSSLDNSGTK